MAHKDDKDNPALKKKPSQDISGIWRDTDQASLYKLTGEPKPAVALAKANSDKFHPNCAAYAWNNEPASVLSKIMDYRGKTGFGVLASGDQPFIFMQCGLDSYLGFDISQLACFWNELKPAAIRTLSRKEFLEFAVGNNHRESDRENSASVARTISMYDRVRDQLTTYAMRFFDELMERNGNRNCIVDLLKDNNYFRGGAFEFREKEVPYVQNDKAYAKLQDSLQKNPYKLIWLDLESSLKVVPREKFDMIFISNILDRWKLFGGDFENILFSMRERLKDDKEAKIIGNYQLGYGVADEIESAAQKTMLKFTAHIRGSDGLNNYWLLQHDR